jgi:8-oxo-dGTP pyrophosphatase MutT (NUDIX family)
MLRRSEGRLLPRLWQGVSGGVEDGETIAAAALREVAEETGITGDTIEAFYTLDHVVTFYWEPLDRALTSVYFAMRVAAGTEPVLSHEHDACRWLPVDEALELSVWPAYREGIQRVRDCLLDPVREPWFVISQRDRAVD